MTTTRSPIPILLVLALLLQPPGPLSPPAVADDAGPEKEERPGAGAATAAPGDAPIPTDFQERVRVQLVQMNFIATDRKGNPVTDLRADEIEIIDEGERQEVAFLQPYYSPRAPAPEEARRPAPAPPPAAESPAIGPVTPGRWIVLVLDNYSSSPGTRLKAVEAAREFVSREVSDTDQVSIISFTGRLDVLQAFTSDRNLLKAACDRALAFTDRAAEDRFLALEELMQVLETCSSSPSPSTCAEHHLGAFEDARIRQADAFLTALLLLTRALAPIPDVKTLVLFSEGFSRVPSEESMDAVASVLGPEVTRGLIVRPDPRTEESLGRLAEAAAAARTSIFTINPGGAMRHSAISARRRGRINEVTNPDQVDVHRRSEMNHQQGLVELARRTGGVASQKADVLEGLRGMIDLARGLYTVGWYPTGELGPARVRDVKIKVLRKGVEVQSRREVPVAMAAPPLTGALSVEPEACNERGRRVTVLRLRLDRSRLQFEKVGGDFASNFSLYVRFVGEEAIEPLFQDYHFFNITYSREEMAEGGLPDPVYERTLIVPCRPLTALVTATDAASGARGDFSAVLPGPPQAAGGA